MSETRNKVMALAVMAALLLSPLTVHAQTNETAQDPGSQGIGPDSPFWGIDVALDNIRMALANTEDEKARVGLEIAQERLQEIKASAGDGDLNSAQRAQNEHARTMEEVRQRIRSLEEGNESEELERVMELEREVRQHESEVGEAESELEIEVRGQLNEQQKELLNAFLKSMDNSTDETKIEIRQKKGGIAQRMRERGMDSSQIREVFNETENRTGLQGFFKEGAAERIEQAEDQLDDAREAALELADELGEDVDIEEPEEDTNETEDNETSLASAERSDNDGQLVISFQENETEEETEENETEEDDEDEEEIEENETEEEEEEFNETEEREEALRRQAENRLETGLHLIERAEFHLDVARQAFEQGTYGKAYGQATAALSTARNAERVMEGAVAGEEAMEDAEDDVREMEEEIEIEIEQEDNVTDVEVKVKRGGIEEEHEFTLQTTDSEEIIAEIAERTSLTQDEVELYIGPALTTGESVRAKFEQKVRQRFGEDREEMERELEIRGDSSGEGPGLRDRIEERFERRQDEREERLERRLERMEERRERQEELRERLEEIREEQEEREEDEEENEDGDEEDEEEENETDEEENGEEEGEEEEEE